MLNIEAVKAFHDNYLWVFRAGDAREICVVDPGDAAPVQAWLDSNGFTLAAILVTHHHADHIGGIDQLRRRAPVPVFGPATPKIPQITHAVAEGMRVEVLGHSFEVIAVPGHTLEHIAYFHAGAEPVVFCGDTLFAAGCGRMFEGTAPVMHASLLKLAALPPETRVYCAHEYTLSNLRFAAAVLPDDADIRARIASESAKRARDIPTVPSTIALELRTNPFLRCLDATVVAAARRHDPAGGSDGAAVFGTLRRWKDGF